MLSCTMELLATGNSYRNSYFYIYMSFLTDFINHRITNIGSVNYAGFHSGGHIAIYYTGYAYYINYMCTSSYHMFTCAL